MESLFDGFGILLQIIVFEEKQLRLATLQARPDAGESGRQKASRSDKSVFTHLIDR